MCAKCSPSQCYQSRTFQTPPFWGLDVQVLNFLVFTVQGPNCPKTYLSAALQTNISIFVQEGTFKLLLIYWEWIFCNSPKAYEGDWISGVNILYDACQRKDSHIFFLIFSKKMLLLNHCVNASYTFSKSCLCFIKNSHLNLIIFNSKSMFLQIVRVFPSFF